MKVEEPYHKAAGDALLRVRYAVEKNEDVKIDLSGLGTSGRSQESGQGLAQIPDSAIKFEKGLIERFEVACFLCRLLFLIFHLP